MTELLKRYYEIDGYYRSPEIRGRYADIREWSAALSSAQAALLEKMNVQELLSLRNEAFGMYRTIFAPYLRAAKEREQLAEQAARQALNNDLAATTAAAV
jgi:hypothetical protein